MVFVPVPFCLRMRARRRARASLAHGPDPTVPCVTYDAQRLGDSGLRNYVADRGGLVGGSEDSEASSVTGPWRKRHSADVKRMEKEAVSGTRQNVDVVQAGTMRHAPSQAGFIFAGSSQQGIASSMLAAWTIA